ncbi:MULTISPECIES: SagB/ThcOx family dehydrogenase [unclassified Lysinibacillus]|uniref:SagB/ThcOx family dehydrogenase n=1 Tax=unclassified Lysinibacillus TaxID=2636778 RepID=UPI0038252522
MKDSYVYEFYHNNSKNYLSQILNAPGKSFNIDSDGKQYPLSNKNYCDVSNVNGTITSSFRSYEKVDLKMDVLLQILKKSYFLEKKGEEIKSLTPSAGGLYPIEMYVLTSTSHYLKGTYHYLRSEAKLNYIRDAIEFDSFLPINNSFVYSAPFVIVMTARMEEIINKYGARGYRYALLEAGHIGQNISRAIMDNPDLGCCAIGGFYDDKLHSALNLPLDEVPLYLYCIGQKGEFT